MRAGRSDKVKGAGTWQEETQCWGAGRSAGGRLGVQAWMREHAHMRALLGTR